MTPILSYSRGSQHSRRVLVLAHELSLDLVLEELEYGPKGFGGDDRDAFLALNPNGKVPVLQHGDLVLWESNAIMWYLAERHGDNPLWPRDPVERARVAMWQVWQAAHLSVAADGLFYENLVKPGFRNESPDPAAVEHHLNMFHRWLGVMEHYLASSDHLALGRFTCADISCASALLYAEQARMPVAEHPRVADWLQRIRARESWTATA